MKKALTILIVIGVLGFSSQVFALATSTSAISLIPFQNSKYYLGTTSPSTIAWKSVITDQLCLTGDACRTTWPTGGGGSFPFDIQTWGVSTTTTLGLFKGFISNSSSTINANLLINGNSTTTNATSTNFFATTASSTSNYTSRLFLGNGSAGSPSLTFSNDSVQDTGLYWGGENVLTFAAGGGSISYTTTGPAFRPNVDLSTDLGGSAQRWRNIYSLSASTTNILAVGSSTFQNFTSINSTTTNATTTSVYISGSGEVGAPSLKIGTTNVGIYAAGASTLGLTNGVAGLSWNGSAFYPNTDNARNLGISTNRWLNLWLSGNSTTTNSTTTNAYISGDTTLVGALYDYSTSAGTAGNILMTTGTGIQWVASSTLSNATAYKQASNYATVAALPANNYANGSGGVGATITEIGFGALSVDGASPTAGQRILVKNEGTAANNGIYTVTAVGSGIAAFVLTRATDFNNALDVYPGVATYVVSGSTLNDTTWVMTSASPITMGTTDLNFSELGVGGSSFTAGSVLFSDGSKITQDNASFSFDDTLNKLTVINLVVTTATATRATSTNFYISNDASTTNFYGANLLPSCNGSANKLTYTSGGKFLCEADQNSGATSIGKAWELVFAGDFLSASGTPTTYKSVVIGATTTASLDKGALFQVNATGTVGTLIKASSTLSFAGKFFQLMNSAGTELFRIDSTGALQTTASSTFQNFTGLQATTTNATTTNLYISTDASTTNFYGANLLPSCNGSANKVTYTSGGKFLCEADQNNGGSYQSNSKFATTTNLVGIYPSGGTNIAVIIGRTATTTNSLLEVNGTTTATTFIATSTGFVARSQFQDFSASNSTTTNATSTSLFATNASTTNLFFTTLSGGNITSSGNIQGALHTSTLGTALLPSYTFLGDPDTGMWSPAANTVAFSTNGTEKFRINSGASGFGTTTSQWLLQLASGTAPQLVLSDASSTAALSVAHWAFRNINGWLYVATSSATTFATSTMSAFTIDGNANVGIGSTTPRAKLGVQGDALIQGNLVIGGDATTTNLYVKTNASTTNLYVGTGVGCLETNASGKVITSTGVTCSTASNQIGILSTTSVQNLSSSTLESIPLGKNLHVTFEIASTSDNNAPIIWFNDKFAGWKDIYLWNGEFDAANSSANNTSYINMGSNSGCVKGCKLFIDLVTTNGTSSPKMGRLTYFYATSSPDGITTTVGSQGTVSFLYTSTTRAIQSISIGHLGNPPLTGASANYIGAQSTTTAYTMNP